MNTLLGQSPVGNAGLSLNPNMMAATACPPNDLTGVPISDYKYLASNSLSLTQELRRLHRFLESRSGSNPKWDVKRETERHAAMLVVDPDRGVRRSGSSARGGARAAGRDGALRPTGTAQTAL